VRPSCRPDCLTPGHRRLLDQVAKSLRLERLSELEAVAEGIRDVEAPHVRDRLVVGCVDSPGSQARGELLEVRDDEARMRPARRDEGVVDPDVELLRAGAEPAAAAGGELRRLRKLLEAEQPAVERPGLRLAACRGGDLHVVDAGDRHPPRSTIGSVASAPPPVEDTLVSGYRRLASDAEHRRIDFELRALDIFFAALFGIVLLPVALAIAAIVRATSGPPVLYRGERVGRRGRFFLMLKFRTLRPGAEERIGQYLGEELMRRTDAELTRIGRWLKASQLDEIPQLWNVLRGDMSFVGPRPIRPRFFAELAHDLPAYWQRLVVPPGLTGFAQVRRGYETSMAEKLSHDLEWVADRSVRLYLRTLAVTGVRVLGQSLGRRT
jgi:lipopolysaccharide/colanic/teichoic acid biosynthesis glycosyltransferase